MRYVDIRRYKAYARSFGACLREERHTQGLTRIALAKLTGLNADTILKIEHGEALKTTLRTAIALLDALDIEYGDFLRKVKAKQEAEDDSN